MPRSIKGYDSQKFQAKLRGIAFKFTFKEWVAWWEAELGPEWQSKRGCHKGQYVMARIGDRGNYEIGNVKCILHTDNTKEARNNIGVSNPRVKLTEQQARFIKYSSKSNKSLAGKFNIATTTVAQIKRGARWGHLGPEPVGSGT